MVVSVWSSPLRRRPLLIRLAAPLVPALVPGGGLRAQTPDWPARPIRLLLGVPPGGTLDFVVRAIQDGLESTLGQPLVVEYAPGEGGATAQAEVARAAPDGYLLLLANTAPFVMTPHLGAAAFPALDRFTFIAQIAMANYVVVVRAESALRNLRDAIGWLSAHEGGASFASTGVGTASHLLGELLASVAGIRLGHRPVGSTAAAAADVIAGRVQVLVDSVGALLPEIRRGRLLALAVTGAQRDTTLPAVPTAAEQGWPALQSSGFQGLVGPAGLPQAIVQRLAGELARVLQQGEVRRRLREAGSEALFRDGPAFAALVRAERERWATLVVQRGLAPR